MNVQYQRFWNNIKMVKAIHNNDISKSIKISINNNNNNNDDDDNNNDNDDDNTIKVELLVKTNHVNNIHSMFSSLHGFSLINCINTIGQLRNEVLNQMLSKLKELNDDDATKNILDRLKSDKEMLPPPHLPSTFALLQIISSILLHVTFALLLYRSPNIQKMISYKKLSNNNIINANAVFITYQSLITNNTISSNYNEISNKEFIVPLNNVDDEIISYFNKSSSLKSVICNLFPSKKLKKKRNDYMIKKFEFQNQPYYIYSSNDSNVFFKGIPTLDFTFSTLLNEITNDLSGGLSNKLANVKHKLYGPNKIITPLPSFWDQMQRRFFNPTEVYQTLSQFFSVLEEPLGYPLFRILCDNIIKCFDVFRNYYATRFLYEASQKSQFNNTVWICRESKWCKFPVEDIVPGDVIALDKGHVPSDCLILQGNAVVNEASQTGESIPQIRTAVDLISNIDSKLSTSSHEKHILKSGTEIVQLSSKLRKNDLNIKIYMENNKIPTLRCLVLRTGSNSFQGSLNSKIKQLDSNEIYGTLLQRQDYFKLLSILYSSAIFASGFVLLQGIQDKSRNMFRLMVQVTRILMSMAPPDLYSSITGSVNIGLRGLSTNNHIHCLEPMKLSVAGIVNTCLFDKTGTLTTDKVMINGFTSLSINAINNEVPLYAIDGSIQASIASCHSLFNLGGSRLTGDPIEIAMFGGLSNKSKSKHGYWSYNSTEKVASIKKKNTLSVYINKTYEFDSDLQLMSAVSLVTNTGNTNNYYQLVSKGSPESIFSCLTESQRSDANFTSRYFKAYNSLTRSGKRVLALASKKVVTLNASQVLNKRDFVESNLTFQGFLSFSCPLRNDTKSAITDLNDAKIKLAMITGDALVTACYVASTSGILSDIDKSDDYDTEDNIHDSLDDILVLKLSINGSNSSRQLQWVTLEGQIIFKYSESDDYNNDQEDEDEDDGSTSMTAIELRRLGNYNLAITGDVVNHLRYHTSLSIDKVMKELTNFKVFARINPSTKTFIVQAFKYDENVVLMCGDGGNDVGALKAADVGVALLQNEKEDTKSINTDPDSERISLRIGDASVAAPFTSRFPTIQSVVHILRYGRSTQALILQNYLSTTLDCLLNGYSLSVLYLQGTKFSQQQLLALTVVSYLVNIGYFMVKPLDRISSKKLPISVFNYKMIMKVIIYLLIFTSAMTMSQKMFNDSVIANELISDYYIPNTMSSIIFLFGLLQIITVPAFTFLGRPYIKDLHEQKKISIAIIASFAFMIILLSELIPTLNELLLFQISTPISYKKVFLVLLLFGSTGLMIIVNRLLK